MKKLFSSLGRMLLLTTLSLALTACGAAGEQTFQEENGKEEKTVADAADSEAEQAAGAAEGDLLETIKAKGTITIAMEGNWQPWTYEDEEGNLVGFEVEVATAVAEKLGVTPEFVTGAWDGLLAGVKAGRYDIMANGVGYSDERALAYNFSDFYAFNKTALVVRKDNGEIKTLEDLKGKTTCNSANSSYQLIAEKYGATVKDVETLQGTIDELEAGRVDATLNAEVSINDYLNTKPDANIKIVAYDTDVERVGMIMPAGESTESLREAVNSALSELRSEGKLKEISTKYFGMDITNE